MTRNRLRGPWAGLLGLAGAVVAVVAPFPATGQGRPSAMPCAARATILGNLAAKFGEHRIAAGVTTTGTLVEVLSSAKGGTWNIIVTTSRGTSCLVTAGEGWRTIESTDEGDGA